MCTIGSFHCIFDADKFSLLYHCLPTKTHHLSGETCSAGKNSKVRLTSMAAASATVEKLITVGLGKSTTSQIFEKIMQLPWRYRSQKKNWMTGDLFREWVRKLSSSLRAEDRKVLLLINNTSVHPEIINLATIKLIFIPPNTISTLHPMDHGRLHMHRSLGWK